MSENELTAPGGKLRLYVESSLGTHLRVTPGDQQIHYLLHVMRAKHGDRVNLFNGRDGEWSARIVDVSKRSCLLACEQMTKAQSEVPDVWLCFAPVKKVPADYLVQKATELGARVLQPVMTKRTIVGRVNLERMCANAVEAAEQSGRLSVPEIRLPLTIDELLSTWPAERRLIFCDEHGDALPMSRAIGAEKDQHFAILTGPEGGFEPSERVSIRAKPFAIPVSLGPRILRADTAALAALAIWQSVRGDWH